VLPSLAIVPVVSLLLLAPAASAQTACVVEPTLASFQCRMVELETDAAAALAAGGVRDRLLRQLGRGVLRVEAAQELCPLGDRRRTEASLRHAVRALGNFRGILGRRAARAIVPAGLRDALADRADDVSGDLRAFKNALVCPETSTTTTRPPVTGTTTTATTTTLTTMTGTTTTATTTTSLSTTTSQPPTSTTTTTAATTSTLVSSTSTTSSVTASSLTTTSSTTSTSVATAPSTTSTTATTTSTTTIPSTTSTSTTSSSTTTTTVEAVCGNGTPEGDEECDDGNDLNTDACTTACLDARCGDNFTFQGVEDCDDGNRVEDDFCRNDCTFAPAVCGDGVRQSGETCDDGNTQDGDDCPPDCRIGSCVATGTRHAVGVTYVKPAAAAVGGLVVFLHYPDGTVGIPGLGNATQVRGRIAGLQTGFTHVANDLDYALRETLAPTTPGASLASGQIFTVSFDLCFGATAPLAASFTCTVQSASTPQGQDIDLGQNPIPCAVATP
jgi:cysteine-rich repeat protein